MKVSWMSSLNSLSVGHQQSAFAPNIPHMLTHYPYSLSIPSNNAGPLFTESATEREMKAVDAENGKNFVLDGRRWVCVYYVTPLTYIDIYNHHHRQLSMLFTYAMPFSSQTVTSHESCRRSISSMDEI